MSVITASSPLLPASLEPALIGLSSAPRHWCSSCQARQPLYVPKPIVNLKCHLIGLPQPVTRLITCTSLTSRHHAPGFSPTSLAIPSEPPLRIVPIPSDLQLWGAPGFHSSLFILAPQGTCPHTHHPCPVSHLQFQSPP